jgi:uncharacterized membrane protein/3-hydroxymyristoyl/3-hydroxydecanoyl-(acyl carrier protein) dehydratase
MPVDAKAERPTDKVVRVLGALLLAAYPLCVYFALGRVSFRPLSVGLTVVVVASFLLRTRGKKGEHVRAMASIPLSIGVLLLLGAVWNDPRFVLALPVLTNAVLFAQFAASLRGVPIAERFARAQEDELTPRQVAYCRTVTVVWCVFFVVNGGITAALAAMGAIKLWAAYAGGISYGLVGLLAAAEYGVRRWRFGTSKVHRFDLRPRPGRPSTFDVHVPANLAYFEGHFPGHPILPGVVQIERLIARPAAALWPELAHVRRITRLRFKRPIRPGDDLVVAISRRERGAVDFDVRCGSEACSSGTLHFEI